MKNWLLLFTLVVGGLSTLKAQDPAVFNHYVQSPIILNPAAAGFNGEYRVMLNTRAAWAGFEEAPRTLALRANGPIGESFGIGFTYATESAARRARNKGQVDFSFKLGFGKDEQGNAAFEGALGFFLEYQRFTIDPSVLQNPVIDMSDPRLLEGIDGENRFDAGIGFYGSYLKNTFGGLTINNLVANRLEDISGRTVNEGLNYTFLLGHHFQMENNGVTLTPSLMMRNVRFAPFMLDVNFQAGFLDDQFIAGLSYRNLGSLGILFGTNLKGFRAYYAYDLGFDGLQQFSNGSHELTIGYVLTRREMKAARARRARQSNSRGR